MTTRGSQESSRSTRQKYASTVHSPDSKDATLSSKVATRLSKGVGTVVCLKLVSALGEVLSTQPSLSIWWCCWSSNEQALNSAARSGMTVDLMGMVLGRRLAVDGIAPSETSHAGPTASQYPLEYRPAATTADMQGQCWTLIFVKVKYRTLSLGCVPSSLGEVSPLNI
ncbi:hypothetical protein Tco_0261750 [Tanacetum coccineum]